jgi:PAS domain S-box-containing protein
MPVVVKKSGAQKAAEGDVAAFREALGPFVTAAETTRMPMMFTDAKDPKHPIVFVNQAFLTLSGYDEHEVLGQSFDFLMEQGTDHEMLAEIQTAFEGGRDLDPLVRYRRKDGAGVWLRIFITPVRGEDGEILQHFASFVDVTEHKEEEDRLRRLMGDLGFQPKK